MHLYLHVPFCARRCSYCDFAIAVRKRIPSRAYADAVLLEWQQWNRRSDAHDMTGPAVDTLYFGGGTPSLLEPDELARIVEGLTSRHPLAPGAEVTLEANPDDVTPARAAAWRRAGIGRVSLGVQSFDPAVLTWMHRTHRAEQVAPAVEALRGAGIGQVSLDLIFAMPAEVPRDWARDLEQALALAPDHLSLYGLTVEDHTPLARWVSRRQVRAAEDDRYAAEFLAAHSALSGAGFEHYEVSNYALPGRRARHNSAYWRRATYIGLGPSAHSAFERERRWNVREWAEYERALTAGESVVGGREVLDDAALRLEEIYLGLRTADGLPADRLPAPVVASWVDAGWALSTSPTTREGEPPRSSSPPGPLSTFVERGSSSRIRLTAEGWLRLDALVAMVS
ncbi:MAG TPA: radical SAM family heme chaperone HemW [Gemmatimonadales bacterium]|nr:radical SAM family heme chaperone HemW [Gemmatimonadales bacterium]